MIRRGREGQAVERNRFWESGSGEILGQPSLQFLESCERFLPVHLDPGQFGFLLSDPTADGFGIRHGSGNFLQDVIRGEDLDPVDGREVFRVRCDDCLSLSRYCGGEEDIVSRVRGDLDGVPRLDQHAATTQRCDQVAGMGGPDRRRLSTSLYSSRISSVRMRSKERLLRSSHLSRRWREGLSDRPALFGR